MQMQSILKSAEGDLQHKDYELRKALQEEANIRSAMIEKSNEIEADDPVGRAHQVDLAEVHGALGHDVVVDRRFHASGHIRV